MHIHAVVLLTCGTVALAAEPGAGGGWRFDPQGRMWCEFYEPYDDSTFMDFGGEINALLRTPSGIEFFVSHALRSQAGHHYSDNEHAPRTPVDMIHQSWRQAMGVSLPWHVPVHVYLTRDCNHLLDKGGFDPVVWTDAVVGAGTLRPFGKTIPGSDRRSGWGWFAGGGPALRMGEGSIWTSNSSVIAEGWLRGVVARPVWSWGNADFQGELALQENKRVPRLRHLLRTEAGLTLHAHGGGWRFYGGQRWRDTRVLWPADQRTYVGFEFVF